MKMVNDSPRKPWTAPVLGQLTVDLDAIASNKGLSNDGSGLAAVKS